MEWQLILILVLVIPIVIFPAAFIWYINIGGMVHALRDIRAKKVAMRKEHTVSVKND